MTSEEPWDRTREWDWSNPYQQPVVRILWHSTDGGRTWRECEVLARSPLSGGVSHPTDGWWDDGCGNLYRNAPPPVRGSS